MKRRLRGEKRPKDRVKTGWIYGFLYYVNFLTKGAKSMKFSFPSVDLTNFSNFCKKIAKFSSRVPLQYFPLGLPFALFCTHKLSQVRAHPTKGHVTCQVACAKCLVACYIPLSTPNMSKTCLEMARWKKKTMGQRADRGKNNCPPLITMGIP